MDVSGKRSVLDSVRIYLVTDRQLARGRDELEIVRRAVAAGVSMVQYREKELPDEQFREKATRLIDLTRRLGVPLIINDRVEIAAEIGADGVHVGQEDKSLSEAFGIVGEHRIVGVSCSSVEHAKSAIAGGADYLGVGALFPTGTKEVEAIVGPDLIRRIREFSDIPIFGIGGIDAGNCRDVIDAGATGIAVISAIVAAPDISKAVGQLLGCFPGTD